MTICTFITSTQTLQTTHTTNSLQSHHHASTDLDCPMFFLIRSNETTRLLVRHTRVDVIKYFFGNRIVKIWNSLPATAEEFACIRKFKCFIEHVDLSRL